MKMSCDKHGRPPLRSRIGNLLVEFLVLSTTSVESRKRGLLERLFQHHVGVAQQEVQKKLRSSDAADEARRRDYVEVFDEVADYTTQYKNYRQENVEIKTRRGADLQYDRDFGVDEEHPAQLELAPTVAANGTMKDEVSLHNEEQQLQDEDDRGWPSAPVIRRIDGRNATKSPTSFALGFFSSSRDHEDGFSPSRLQTKRSSTSTSKSSQTQPDGLRLGYTHWNRGEPNNWGGHEDCMTMIANGRWNDLSCGHRLYFVCSKASVCDGRNGWRCHRNGGGADAVSYKVFTQSRSWDQAAAECYRQSATLAIITNGGENNVVRSLIQGRRWTVWIGGNDINQEGNWRWPDAPAAATCPPAPACPQPVCPKPVCPEPIYCPEPEPKLPPLPPQPQRLDNPGGHVTVWVPSCTGGLAPVAVPNGSSRTATDVIYFVARFIREAEEKRERRGSGKKPDMWCRVKFVPHNRLRLRFGNRILPDTGVGKSAPNLKMYGAGGKEIFDGRDPSQKREVGQPTAKTERRFLKVLWFAD
ncbi:unnamed protein product [Amoebophrya sp. A25]|nr:unnamed protein product [Amoebophrya sp. A25]|eukprot:GSA25T00004575001.1